MMMPSSVPTPSPVPNPADHTLPAHFRPPSRRVLVEQLRRERPAVLVLSGSVGMGHVRAAESLSTALTTVLPDVKSAHLDAVKLMSRPVQKMYADGYLSLMEKAPTMLGVAYRMTDSPSANSDAAVTFDRFLARRLEKLLIELNPPVLVCTHFLSSRVAGHLKESGQISSTLLQIVTDFDLHRFWLVPQTDHYFVGGAPAAERLKALGTPVDKITLSGIPIGAQFAALPSKEAARQELRLPADLPTILITLGGAGRAPFIPVFESLQKITTPASIVFVCGKNEEARLELEKRTSAVPPHLQFHIQGFTTKMHLYMAASDILVGKPGGLTMSETLATGLVPVLIQPIPGQEEHNADYLLEAGVALRCRYLDQLHSAVQRLLESPTELHERAERSQTLGRPHAAAQIAARVQQYLNGPKVTLSDPESSEMRR